MQCMVCWAEDKENRHVNLYPIGSEGLIVCHNCEIIIVGFVRSLMLINTKGRKQGYKNAKTVAAAKQLVGG